MTTQILKEEIGLKFQSYPIFEDVMDKTFLAIINVNAGIEIVVAKIDEEGFLLYADTGDDVGWEVHDVALWADLQDVYDAADRFFVMPFDII
jgi:hypothetical protein